MGTYKKMRAELLKIIRDIERNIFQNIITGLFGVHYYTRVEDVSHKQYIFSSVGERYLPR